jgi:hypothetical protein
MGKKKKKFFCHRMKKIFCHLQEKKKKFFSATLRKKNFFCHSPEKKKIFQKLFIMFFKIFKIILINLKIYLKNYNLKKKKKKKIIFKEKFKNINYH